MKSPRFVTSALASKCKLYAQRNCETAKDQYRAQYGVRLADEIASPLTEAWSGYPVDELSASVAQKFARDFQEC